MDLHIRPWFPFISSLLLFCPVSVLAQTGGLSLSEGSAPSGGTAVVNLSLSGASSPAGLQWTLTYAATDISNVSMTAGPVLTAAGKSLACAAAPGAYTCLAVGLNTTAISDGVVATANVTVTLASGNTNVGVSNTLGALPSGDSVTVNGTGNSITVTPTINLSSLGCSSTSIVPPGSVNCTVTLSAAAPAGGTTVILSSSAGSLTVPDSVTVAAGSTSTSFTAAAALVTTNQSASITATLSGSSRTANVMLTPTAAPPVLTTSVACSPSSLAPGDSTTCTVILSGPAPSGGSAVTLISSSSALTVPASLTVPAASTSASFTATESSVTAAEGAAVTASLGTSLLANTVMLNPAGGPAVLKVGPGQTYSRPCEALTAAADGATVQIDAGTSYSGDVCAVLANNLTIRGVNGRPKIDAAGLNAAGKGTWVFEGNNITVDTMELTGATSPSPNNNGAGIRMEGQNLTVLSSYIHDNQEGVLVNTDPSSQILIQSTEFNHNGFGDGLTHNIHVLSAARLTVQYSYSHNGNAGHLLETGAAENYVLYNRLTSEDGTTSVLLNINNGGRSFVLGNLVEKGLNDQAGGMLGYLLGGPNANNPSTELYVANNTFVNDQAGATHFLDISAADPTAAVVTNNIFCGPGTISTQNSSVLNTNLTSNPLFVNQGAYDYHLTSASPAINTGSPSTSAGGVSLTPVYEHLDSACAEARNPVGTIDIGAYEFGGAGTALPCAQSLSSINLNPSVVTGGTSTTANTVTLGNPAPSTGASVMLTSSNPSVASVPATVALPEGATSTFFTITTSSVTSSAIVVISSTYAGTTQTATLNVVAPVTVSSLQCSPTSLSPGAASTCTITLSAAAPAGGVSVAVSDNSAMLTTPASMGVAAGATSATFSATAGTISNGQAVTVTASLNGVSQNVTLNLIPPVSMSSLACSPASLGPNSSSTCTVTLSNTAPTGGANVTLASTNLTLTVPASVTVAAAATSATFSATTATISSDQSATVTATYNSSSANTTVSLVASVLVSSLACNPASLGPNSSSTCTITLTKAAPAGGAIVTLSDTSSAFTVPASVTAAAAATSVSFKATTAAISGDQNTTTTATYNGSSANTIVSLVAPVLVSSLACNPASLASGATSTCTVTLTKAASSGGTSVALSDDNSLLTTPSSVKVAKGSTSATFTATAGTIVTNQNATVSATLNSANKSVTIGLTAPATLSTLACNATSLTSNASATCTVTLATPALSGGVAVSLSDSSNLLNSPASVTVAPGSTSANFTVSARSIRRTSSATVTAKLGTISKSVTLQLAP
jgi:hypothetical protein